MPDADFPDRGFWHPDADFPDWDFWHPDAKKSAQEFDMRIPKTPIVNDMKIHLVMNN